MNELDDLQKALDRNFFEKELSLRKRLITLINNLPLELDKVGRTYECTSVGTKKQWVEWFIKYSTLLEESNRFDETLAEKVSVFRQSLEVEAKTTEQIIKRYQEFKKEFRLGGEGHQDSYQKAIDLRKELEDARWVDVKQVFGRAFATDKSPSELKMEKQTK